MIEFQYVIQSLKIRISNTCCKCLVTLQHWAKSTMLHNTQHQTVILVAITLYLKLTYPIRIHSISENNQHKNTLKTRIHPTPEYIQYQNTSRFKAAGAGGSHSAASPNVLHRFVVRPEHLTGGLTVVVNLWEVCLNANLSGSLLKIYLKISLQ